jgi:hypothetical protein
MEDTQAGLGDDLESGWENALLLAVALLPLLLAVSAPLVG